MKREELKELLVKYSIEENKDLINDILNAHNKEIEPFKNSVKKEDYDLINTELTELKKKVGDYDDLAKFKADTIEEKNKVSKQNKLSTYFDELKIDKKVQSLLYDKVGADFDKDFNLTNKDTIKNLIEKDYKDFVIVSKEDGAKYRTPPTTDPSTITKEQFAKMGYNARVKLANDNPELYNNLKGE